MINSRSSRILVFLGGVFVIGFFASGSSEIPVLKVGDVVPDLKLIGSDGKSHSFRNIIADGEGLVIAWIPKTGTPG